MSAGANSVFVRFRTNIATRNSPAKSDTMLEKKHLVFLAGATAPFAPPLCTALLIEINLLRRGKTGKMPKKLPRELRSVWNTLSRQFICSKLEILLVDYSYYIHTEKYSPKSFIVNFRTQISSSQSESRTMFFHV